MEETHAGVGEPRCGTARVQLANLRKATVWGKAEVRKKSPSELLVQGFLGEKVATL